MRINWVFQTGVASIALIALAACSSTTTSGTAGAGGTITTTTSDNGGMGGSTGTGTFTGSKTCNNLLTGNDWDSTLTGSDFDSEDAFNAYDALNTCACVNKNSATPAGCENICEQPDNGTTTNNFCNGVAALPQCSTCLTGSCASEMSTCMSN